MVGNFCSLYYTSQLDIPFFNISSWAGQNVSRMKAATECEQQNEGWSAATECKCASRHNVRNRMEFFGHVSVSLCSLPRSMASINFSKISLFIFYWLLQKLHCNQQAVLVITARSVLQFAWRQQPMHHQTACHCTSYLQNCPSHGSWRSPVTQQCGNHCCVQHLLQPQTSGSYDPTVTSRTLHFHHYCLQQAVESCARQMPDRQSVTVRSCGLTQSSLQGAHWPDNKTSIVWAVWRPIPFDATKISASHCTITVCHKLAVDHSARHCASLKTVHFTSSPQAEKLSWQQSYTSIFYDDL